jgi:hypothetical protein
LSLGVSLSPSVGLGVGLCPTSRQLWLSLGVSLSPWVRYYVGLGAGSSYLDIFLAVSRCRYFSWLS